MDPAQLRAEEEGEEEDEQSAHKGRHAGRPRHRGGQAKGRNREGERCGAVWRCGGGDVEMWSVK